jgi:hypothetical protein
MNKCRAGWWRPGIVIYWQRDEVMQISVVVIELVGL